MPGPNQKVKAERFRELHHGGQILVLPNIWDPLGAAMLENLGYAAIATASASIALTHGYADGENIPFSEVLIQLKKIADHVKVPVTADFESGYAKSLPELRQNIQLLIETGIVGINIEDTDKQSGRLLNIEEQCDRIHAINETAAKEGIPLFINARADVYTKGEDFKTEEEKYAETLKRGESYMKAGADCFFPVLMTQKSSIQNLVAALRCPVNIVTVGEVPDLKTLQSIGVARVSLGPSFLKMAIKSMKELALKLRNYEGIAEITSNEITSDYLKKLITENKGA